MTSLSDLPPPPMAKPQTYHASAWDDDGWGNDDDWNFDDLDKPANSKHANNKKSGYDSDHDDEDGVDYNTYNLNKLSDWELKKHKDKMEKKFQKNYIKPGDPGFVYDKRIEFKRVDNSGFDEDDSWDD